MFSPGGESTDAKHKVTKWLSALQLGLTHEEADLATSFTEPVEGGFLPGMTAQYEDRTTGSFHTPLRTMHSTCSQDTEHPPSDTAQTDTKNSKNAAAEQALEEHSFNAAGYIKHWNPRKLPLSSNQRSPSEEQAPAASPPAPAPHKQTRKATVVDILESTDLKLTNHLNGKPEPGQLITQFEFNDHVYCFALSPDGCSIAVQCGWGTVLIVVVATGSIPRRLKCNALQDSLISWSPDGKWFAAVHRKHEGEIQVWDVEQEESLELKGWAGYKLFSWSPCGLQLCAITNGTQQAHIVDLTVDRDPKLVSHPGERAESIAWSPQGETVAVAAAGSVGLWNPHTLFEVGGQKFFKPAKNPKLQAPCSIAWSPDSSMIMCWRSSVVVWNGITADTWTVHDSETQGKVYSAAWSPDSRYIAAGTESSMIRIWTVDTGAEKLAIECPRGDGVPFVSHVAWSPCGRRIFATVGRRVLIFSVFSKRLV